MANKTDSDVINFALEIISRKAQGEDADAETFSRARSIYISLHDDLKRDYEQIYRGNRMSWNYDAVPEMYYSDIVAILAGQLTLFLPCSQEAVQRGLAAREVAEVAIANKFQRANPDANRFDEMLSPVYNHRDWTGW